MKLNKIILTCGLILLQACSPYQHPKTSEINTTLKDDFSKDMIDNYLKNASTDSKTAPGSLWESGAKGFFKDNRAKSIGDIVTVAVTVSISAETSANTEASQSNKSKSGVSNLLNLADNIAHQGITLGAGGLLDTESDRAFKGSGSTDRKDTLKTTIAATVTQVLPNGHMLIKGQREVTINYEKQILRIAGIIRPEDVTANNTISSNQIAQARISYGGEGNVNEVQTKKWGSRFIDRWLPF